MKKWLGVLLTIMLAVSITACGTKAETTNETGLTTTSQTESNQNEANASTVSTIDELITLAKSSTYKLESYAMETSYSQNVLMEEGELKQEDYLKTKTVGEYIVNPAQEHTITELNISGQSATSEEYRREDIGSFSLTDGVWTHRENASDSLMQTVALEGEDVAKMLEQFSLIGKEEIKIAVDGDTYVLTADLTGDKVKTALIAMAEKGDALFPAEMDAEQINSMSEIMNEVNVKFKTVIHKEQLYFISSEVNISMQASEGDAKMTSSFDTLNKISKHNEINQILIPQEVLDSTK